MSNVQYTNSFGNRHFTNGKRYASFIKPDGLAVIDDTGIEHIIATKDNEDHAYDGDTFFRNNFKWVDAIDEPAKSDDPNWSIDCPHCGHKHTNWQDFVDTGDMSGEFPMTCENEACEKEFAVTYDTVITFLTKKNETDEYRVKMTADELFNGWTKELGYNRAVLLSCGYPVLSIAAMTDEDAEAEIEAISE